MVSLAEPPAVSVELAEVIALDDALKNLAEMDPRKAQIVEMKFFGGLSIEEIAEAMGVSPTTVKREWALARAWLTKRSSAANVTG